jgi:hypothetical protein
MSQAKLSMYGRTFCAKYIHEIVVGTSFTQSPLSFMIAYLLGNAVLAIIMIAPDAMMFLGAEERTCRIEVNLIHHKCKGVSAG